MSIVISLSPAAEAALAERARTHGRGLNEYVSEVVERVAGGGDATDAWVTDLPATEPRLKQGTPEWFAAYQEWLDSHEPVGHFVDDSRETIYGGPEGRGE